MASQRMTIMKIGGDSAEVLLQLLRDLKLKENINESEDKLNQVPTPPGAALTRARVDRFADVLRAHGYSLPTIHFVEWWDPWSMGDVFLRCLTPRGVAGPLMAHGDRYEIYGYSLPDEEALKHHLDDGERQQFVEYDHFILRLREAVEAWSEIVDRSLLIILREVLGGLVMDEELLTSMSQTPAWLSEC